MLPNVPCVEVYLKLRALSSLTTGEAERAVDDMQDDYGPAMEELVTAKQSVRLPRVPGAKVKRKRKAAVKIRDDDADLKPPREDDHRAERLPQHTNGYTPCHHPGRPCGGGTSTKVKEIRDGKLQTITQWEEYCSCFTNG
jgi:hypothetical protein